MVDGEIAGAETPYGIFERERKTLATDVNQIPSIHSNILVHGYQSLVHLLVVVSLMMRFVMDGSNIITDYYS